MSQVTDRTVSFSMTLRDLERRDPTAQFIR